MTTPSPLDSTSLSPITTSVDLSADAMRRLFTAAQESSERIRAVADDAIEQSKHSARVAADALAMRDASIVTQRHMGEAIAHVIDMLVEGQTTHARLALEQILEHGMGPLAANAGKKPS